MFELMIAIIVIVCMVVIFKGEFFRKQVGVTVVKNLPLSIFKKKNRIINNDNRVVEDIKIEKENIKEDSLSEGINDADNSEINIEENKEDEKEILDKVFINKEADKEKEDLLKVEYDNLECKNDEIIEYSEIKEDKNEEDIIEKEIEEEARIVYWTPRGKNYHSSTYCRTLSRSKVINSGTIDECEREYACEHCK